MQEVGFIFQSTYRSYTVPSALRASVVLQSHCISINCIGNMHLSAFVFYTDSKDLRDGHLVSSHLVSAGRIAVATSSISCKCI
jgi:hypothetical protein